VQGNPAALFRKPPIPFPLREEPAGGEGADIAKRAEMLVGDVDSHSRRLHLPRLGGKPAQYVGEPRFRIFGDNVDEAVHVNLEVVQRKPFSLICGYAFASLQIVL